MSSLVVHAVSGVRGLRTDVDVLPGNPDTVVVWSRVTEVFADVNTWNEGVDSSGGNVGLGSGVATERDPASFVAAGCVFLDVVAGVGDITG